MLKRRCSLITAGIMAGVCGGLTIIIGIAQDVRMLTIVYRCVVSVVIFAICGYLCGRFVESLIPGSQSITEVKGQQVDIVAQNDSEIIPLPPEQSVDSAKEFSPFTSDNFDRITVESDGNPETN